MWGKKSNKQAETHCLRSPKITGIIPSDRICDGELGRGLHVWLSVLKRLQSCDDQEVHESSRRVRSHAGDGERLSGSRSHTTGGVKGQEIMLGPQWCRLDSCSGQFWM